jgi:two-component system, response regulator YesN
MWKMLIADDEPKIRRGLSRLIGLLDLDLEVVGEAEDGMIALEMVREQLPHLLLVDICMPFLNGLQLIEEVKKINPDCLVIVITGFDEFSYAQQAIKLGVFDYLLKPIVKEQLQSVINKAMEQLAQQTSRKKYTDWTNELLTKNLSFLRERFLDEWMNGSITDVDIKEQMNFLNISLTEGQQGVLVIKLPDKSSIKTFDEEWDGKLLLFAVQNVLTDLLLSRHPSLVFRDRKDHIVAVIPNKSWTEWIELPRLLIEMVEEVLNIRVLVEAKETNGGLTGICNAYEELVKSMENQPSSSPIVALAKRYIDNNFHKVDLSLQEVADAIGISPAYLSRLLRQDLGASFIDYLSQNRVQHALKLLHDPTVKIYEVAEKVGYKGQHYFSTVFKKVLGISPLEYRKGGRDIGG